MITLRHYSSTPFTLDRGITYEQSANDHKPSGLWLSVEGEGMHGWKDYCLSDAFGETGLTHHVEVTLRQDVRIVRLETPDAMLAFGRRYRSHKYFGEFYQSVDWCRVATEYQGILIAPYHWQLRLSSAVRWYYTWDCASACVWGLEAIESVGASIGEIQAQNSAR